MREAQPLDRKLIWVDPRLEDSLLPHGLTKKPTLSRAFLYTLVGAGIPRVFFIVSFNV